MAECKRGKEGKQDDEDTKSVGIARKFSLSLALCPQVLPGEPFLRKDTLL
jgi:hypothetical protein